MSTFKKYLKIITESKYQDLDSDVQGLINRLRLDDDLIKKLQSYKDFDDYYSDPTNIGLKQLVNPIININKDKRYFKNNDFEALKEFIVNF
jgi:hypothetical protein